VCAAARKPCWRKSGTFETGQSRRTRRPCSETPCSGALPAAPAETRRKRRGRRASGRALPRRQRSASGECGEFFPSLTPQNAAPVAPESPDRPACRPGGPGPAHAGREHPQTAPRSGSAVPPGPKRGRSFRGTRCPSARPTPRGPVC